MKSFRFLNNITGWFVFLVGAIVYAMTAEPSGSLWDCGEFISGCHKLQVVHPPGAPLFLMVGRLFAFVAEIFSDDPADIAYAVNVMSGLCTAVAAMCVCWITVRLTKLAISDEGEELVMGQKIAALGAGLVAGLSTLFATSIWFSAVEGEVYAMSTGFTALQAWAIVKWYTLPDEEESDRWLVLVALLTGLSVGIHLLSLLTIPALAVFYYYKKYKNNTTLLGLAVSFVIGMALLIFVQNFIILKLPKLGASMDKMFVNGFGLPFGSGLLFFCILVVAACIGGIYYVTQKGYVNAQKIMVSLAMILIGFSTYGMIVLRAKANTPINMNDPSDAYSLVSYLNREQYGERPLGKGPHFLAKNLPVKSSDFSDKIGKDGDKYDVVDKKVSYRYRSKDEMLFPRLGFPDRASLYDQWLDRGGSKKAPTMGENLGFFFRYQLGWMNLRYMMWNFVGKQNGTQGHRDWDKASGNWLSGVPFVDNARLFDQTNLPTYMKEDKSRNTYFFIPLILGLIGIFFHFKRSPKEFIATMLLFLMTGVMITIYTNQPPSEPRERDYVFAGCVFTFCIWIGMAVAGIYRLVSEKLKGGVPMGVAATAVCLSAPLLMGFQNWDDHSRANLTAARDYASNFLESCDPNAIIFTYGDNDTYPLWYAQEVEGIRTDVRVVNLSLIAVDWYIEQQRRKINNSPKIDFTIPEEAYRGEKRNVVYHVPNGNQNNIMTLKDAISFVGKDTRISVSNGQTLDYYLPTKRFVIPVTKEQALAQNLVGVQDTAKVSNIVFNLNRSGITKDDLAILDIIASNFGKRPIYFAVTIRPEKLQGLDKYLQLEGLAQKLVPIATAPGKDQPNIPQMVEKGGINIDKCYDIIMNKFKWGGFDKHDLYVDHSLAPSTGTIRSLFMRTIENLLAKRDNKRAIDLVDKYFEAFPYNNFPNDITQLFMIEYYIRAGAKDKAAGKMEVYGAHLDERLYFFDSLNTSDLSSFKREQQRDKSVLNRLGQLTAQLDNEEAKTLINDLVKKYISDKQ